MWSYLGSFLLAMSGAALYFVESTGYIQWLGEWHKYTKLLFISLTVLSLGCLMFWIGDRQSRSLRSVAVNAVEA